MTEVAVVANGLSLIFGSGAERTHALDGIDLTIARGEFVSLIGPSGCGKTTLLRAIADLERPTGGTLLVNGTTPEQARRERAYGYVFQAPGLYPWRNVERNVMLPLEIMGLPRAERRERAQRNLQLVGLSDVARRFPWQLSGGMQQRVSIARALSFEPSLLLMDEPFGALDEITRDGLNLHLHELWRTTGMTTVFVTHSIPEAVYLSTRIVVMSPRPGRIVEVIDCDLGLDRPLDIRDSPAFTAVGSRVGARFTKAGRMREVLRRVVPVIVVVAGLLAIWYAAAFIVDAPQGALALTRPLVPQPHQVIATLLAGVLQPLGPRSLIYHAAVTASSATVGFALAFVLGVALAIGIVNLRILDRSLMPWIIASQTIPALAVAPMVVVVLGNIGLTGLIPKALIAAWLSFFPIVTAMVAGLRSPERIQLDLMRTYDAGSWDVFAQLRWPASMGFLFPGMKVAATLAVVGAIVAELPTGAVAGLGARLLGASYYGQTLQLWAALAMASILAVIAVAAVDAGRGVLVRVRGGRL